MSGFDLFMVVWCVCVFLLITVPVIVAHHDRLAVPLMRRFNIPAYPEAVGIALLIYQHPELCSGAERRPRHGEGDRCLTDFARWRHERR